MSSVALGAGAACAASSLYNLGLALQALDARDAPAGDALRLSLLTRLVRRRRWLAGTALNILGWPLQTVALLLAPLAVVQPSLAFGLVLLLGVAGWRMGERVGVREVAAVLAILGGVALLAVVAPEPSTRHAGAAGVAAVLGVVGAVALVPFALRAAGRGGGAAAAIGAGTALAWSGLSTKLVADALHAGDVATLLVWTAATGLASGVGLLAEMTALQQRPATQVAPVVFVVQVLVPVLAAPLLAREHGGHVAATAFGVAVVVAGALVLLASPALRSLVESEAGGAENGTAETGSGRSPRAASRSPNVRSCDEAAGPPSSVTTTMSPGAGSTADAAADPSNRS
jgi:uncharacterized membrane protein